MSKNRTKILLLVVFTLLGFFGVKSYQIIKQKESFGKQPPNFLEGIAPILGFKKYRSNHFVFRPRLWYFYEASRGSHQI